MCVLLFDTKHLEFLTTALPPIQCILPIFAEMKYALLIFPLLLITCTLHGQNEPADSVKSPVYTWKLFNNYADAHQAPLDTGLQYFHIYNPLFEAYEYPAYLGNLGTAGLSNHFFLRTGSDLFFLKKYFPYLNLPENQIYYNTKKPFTHFAYSSGGGRQKQEQVLEIIHTQNVTPSFNVGIKLNVISSDGQYAFQKSNVNAFNFFTSYTGERYSIHGHIGINNLTFQENGGIQDDNNLEDSGTEDVPTQLDKFNDARTQHRNRNVHLVQQLTIGRFKSGATGDSLSSNLQDQKQKEDWGRIIHVLQYRKNHKTYEDLAPGSGFYRNVYINPLLTYDSVYYRSWYNNLSLDFSSNPVRKFRFAARVSIENELNRYSHNIPPEISQIRSGPIQEITLPSGFRAVVSRTDTFYVSRKDYTLSNTSIRGRLVNDLGEMFGWNAEGQLFFQGYKQGNLNLKGEIFLRFTTKKGISELNINGTFRNERPDFWYNNFYSNNFFWQNDLNFENEIRVQSFYDNPAVRLKLSVNLSLLSNHVYFDSLALPSQEISTFPVFSVDLQKDLQLWKIKFLNKINVQVSGKEEVLPLPLLSVRNSTFFDHTFYFPWTKGVLKTQLGFDFYYHTLFYASAYMPATGQFYNQTEKQIGNYPFFDIFLNLKVKRTRIFLKFEHINSGMLGYNFFTILHYPMNQRVLRFGLAWTFYD